MNNEFPLKNGICMTKEDKIEYLQEETHRYQQALAKAEADYYEKERELGKLKALCWRAADSMEALMAGTIDPGPEALSVHYMLRAHGDGTRKPKFLIPFFEVSAMNCYTPYEDVFQKDQEWWVTAIYGYDLNTVESCMDDLMESLKEVAVTIPKGASNVRYRVTDVVANKGEYEEGRCIQRPYWEMDIKVIGFEYLDIPDTGPKWRYEPITKE